MIRILLAEDQAMVRQGLKMMIETDDQLRVTGKPPMAGRRSI